MDDFVAASAKQGAVGEKVKTFRTARRMSLRALGDATGTTASSWKHTAAALKFQLLAAFTPGPKLLSFSAEASAWAGEARARAAAGSRPSIMIFFTPAPTTFRAHRTRTPTVRRPLFPALGYAGQEIPKTGKIGQIF